MRPLHWLDQQTEEWRAYNNTLRLATTPGYAHENTVGGIRASFETPADVALGRPVVRIATNTASLSMIAVGAAPGRATVSGARIEYPDAYPDASLRYTVDNERVKEDVVLRRAPTTQQAASYRFDLDLTGLSAAQQPDGTIRLTDAAGKLQFVMPKPFLRDSSGNPEWEYSDDIQVTLTQLGSGKVRLELAPRLAWLTDPARVYPVTLDPTVEQVRCEAPSGNGLAKTRKVYTGTAPQDVHLFQCCPTQNTAGSPTIHVGKNPSGERRDTLVRFPELDALPPDSAITSAQLRLYAEGGTNGMPMEVHANTATWTESTATWGSMPEATTMGAAVYGTNTTATPGWNSVSVSGLVRYWVTGKLTNHGLRVLSTGGASQSVTFTSGDGAIAANRPQLEVSYVPATRYGYDDLHSYTYKDHGGGNTSRVNVSTGNLVFEHTGGNAFASGGSAVELLHTYNSQDPYGQSALYDKPGAFYGEGWTFSQNMRLYEAGDSSVVYKDATGANHVFAKNANIGAQRIYYSPPNYGYTLTKDVGATPADPLKVYKLSADSGEKILYLDSGGKVTRAEDPLSGTYLIYGYDAQGRLITITDETNRQMTLEYLGSGDPGRLSKIVDMSERSHTYEYDTAGNLRTIKHGVGSADVRTTILGYGVANMLTSVTNPSGELGYIRPQALFRWETAGNADGWAAGARTNISQSTAHAYRESGALRMDLSAVTDAAPGGASRSYATPVAWNSVEQELMGFVYLESGNVEVRLTLEDERGHRVLGPTYAVAAASGWSRLCMPNARIDPGYKVKKLSIEISPVMGVASYTGSVWLDQVQQKGLVDSWTDSQSTPVTVGQMSYEWAIDKTRFEGPAELGIVRTITHTYNSNGEVTDISPKPEVAAVVDVTASSQCDMEQSTMSDETYSVTSYSTTEDCEPGTVTKAIYTTQAIADAQAWRYVTLTGDAAVDEQAEMDLVASFKTTQPAESANVEPSSTTSICIRGPYPHYARARMTYTIGGDGASVRTYARYRRNDDCQTYTLTTMSSILIDTGEPGYGNIYWERATYLGMASLSSYAERSMGCPRLTAGGYIYRQWAAPGKMHPNKVFYSESNNSAACGKPWSAWGETFWGSAILNGYTGGRR